MKIDILYEDNHLIVVRKPVGILSQEDITGDMDMLSMIKDYIKTTYQKPGNVFLGLVHRLDRMVGGIMVFAKTSKGASRLSEQVRTHDFKKNYLAVVHGKTPKEGTLINHLLKDEETNTVSVVNKQNEQGKIAELSYQSIAYKNSMSLVEVDLKTGRPHQIRVQFSHMGHPLYGDKKYGNPEDIGNIALFAYKLSFFHPTTKEILEFKLQPENKFPFNQYDFNELNI